MGAGDDVGDDLGLYRIGHRRFQNSDDDRGTPSFGRVKAHGLSNQGGVGVEGRAPESVGQHHGAGCIGTIVRGAEQASHHGVKSHHVEVVAIDDTTMEFARRAEANDGEVHLGKCA